MFPMPLSLDLQFFAGEKTEKATPKKKQDARKKGQVAKSTDLTNAIVLLFTFSFLLIYGGYASNRLLLLVRQGLSEILLWNVTQDSIPLLFVHLFKEGLIIAAPIIFVTFLAAMLTNIMQVGFLISGESIKFDLKKLDPLAGAKRIFSMKSVVELIKSLLKVSAFCVVGGIFLWQQKGKMLRLSEMEPLTVITFLASLLLKLGLTLSAVYLVIAVGDYIFQRFDHAKQLRMSKQDIKDEHKKMEGDPLIKHKIKEKQRQMSMARMMQDVPKAQVIVTNPTHYAVAIAYDAGEMKVPMIVAKGTDYMALKIKEVAKEHQVVIMENKPLARALYASVEIGQEVPEELFKAVAEVLAYVYRLKGSLNRKQG
jgi:flagellar biosynthesis protein FlhB